MESYMSVTEAAKVKKVTRQAIYLAIREKRLRAYQCGAALKIFKMDLDEFYKKRYSRDDCMYQGEKIFDDERGMISVDKAAKLLGVPKQKVYYACRTGVLKAIRKRASWVIAVEDLMRYERDHLSKYFTRKKEA